MGDYRDVERIGSIALDEASVDTLIKYLETADLPQTHNVEGDVPSDGNYDARGNPGYNKYILYDDLFVRFFSNPSEYQYFLHEVMHTAPLPLDLGAEDEYLIKAMIGTIHGFFSEHYKKFFMLRISVSITEQDSSMHYHRDLAGENADRFVVDLSKPEGKLSGLQVEERLYELDRLAVYKLDTTREHRAVNYSADCKKISLIIQGISELAQYLEYERKHREVYEAFKHRNFQH
ncbi:MAG: hypothetical protein CL908_12660 [Deltaproteobacteria bacterium]|nr:hypothetical protein [Deltaproteobacteria bacterium]